MVRRSFSNPFLRVFSTRRRSKDRDDDDISNRRKESLDQTVLSGDDSRFSRSVASFGDGFSETAIVSSPVAPPVSPFLRRASNSDPTLRYYSPADETCRCPECIAPWDHLHRSMAEFATNYGGAPPPPYSPHLFVSSPAANQQELLQTPNFDDDPTLKARIEAVEIQQRLLGEYHPDVIFALSSLAKLYRKRGDIQGALSIMRESQLRSVRAKTLAYEQQVSRLQQQHGNEMSRGGIIVPPEIFSYENSFGR